MGIKCGIPMHVLYGSVLMGKLWKFQVEQL